MLYGKPAIRLTFSAGTSNAIASISAYLLNERIWLKAVGSRWTLCQSVKLSGLGANTLTCPCVYLDITEQQHSYPLILQVLHRGGTVVFPFPHIKGTDLLEEKND